MTYIDPAISLKDLIIRQRKLYKKFSTTRCSILNLDISFTFAGFEHLHVDGRKRRREVKSARARLLLLEYAPDIISRSIFVKKDFKPAETNKTNQDYTYYELYGRVGANQAMVVLTLRKIGNGKLHFYGIRYK